MKVTPELAELLGIHAGDGYLRDDGRRRELDISGNVEEQEYYDKHISSIFQKEFNIKLNCRLFPSRNTYGFVVRDKQIIKKFHKFGFPYGKKSTIVEIPVGIRKSKDKLILYRFIRGVFDTDGSLTFDRKNNNKYHTYPRIIFGSVSKKFQEQLFFLLKSLDYTVYTSEYIPKSKTEHTSYRIWIVGNKMLEKWIKEIGIKNNSKLSRYLIWKKYGFCPPKTTFEQRRNILKGELDPTLLYMGL